MYYIDEIQIPKTRREIALQHSRLIFYRHRRIARVKSKTKALEIAAAHDARCVVWNWRYPVGIASTVKLPREA